MTPDTLYDLLGDIDPELIEAAEDHRFKKPMNTVKRLLPIAAAILITVSLIPAVSLIMATNGAAANDMAESSTSNDQLYDAYMPEHESYYGADTLAPEEAENAPSAGMSCTLNLSGDAPTAVLIRGANILTHEGFSEMEFEPESSTYRLTVSTSGHWEATVTLSDITEEFDLSFDGT